MKQFLIDGNINWELLKKQKLSLLSAITEFENKGDTGTANHLTGILNLIDNVQDNAVKSGIWEEAEVFLLSEE